MKGFTLCFNDSIRCGLRAPVARPKSVSLTWPVPSTRKFFKGISQPASYQVGMPYLRFEIAVNVSKFVELVDRSKHLTDVEPCMLLFQDPGIIEQCPEVASRHVLHGEVNVLRILEGIQQANQPRCLGGSQDVSFYKNVTDLHRNCEWSGC